MESDIVAFLKNEVQGYKNPCYTRIKYISYMTNTHEDQIKIWFTENRVKTLLPEYLTRLRENDMFKAVSDHKIETIAETYLRKIYCGVTIK